MMVPARRMHGQVPRQLLEPSILEAETMDIAAMPFIVTNSSDRLPHDVILNVSDNRRIKVAHPCCIIRAAIHGHAALCRVFGCRRTEQAFFPSAPTAAQPLDCTATSAT